MAFGVKNNYREFVTNDIKDNLKMGEKYYISFFFINRLF